MSPNDPNFLRWLAASINVYFEANKGEYTLIPAGTSIKVSEDIARVELNINGPRYKEKSKGFYDTFLEINLTCLIGPTEDLYNIDRQNGFLASKLGTIPIKKYGPSGEIDNESTQIGLIVLRNDVSSPVEITKLGQYASEINLHLTSIDGYYRFTEC